MRLRYVSTTVKCLIAVLLTTTICSPHLKAQTFGVLYNFTGSTDGGNPLAGLAIDESGNLYGTASIGGTYGVGVVFKVNSGGAETVLHNFRGGPDGAYPDASLLMNSTTRTLYGTASAGGAHNFGAVFQLSQAGERILYSFKGEPDGANPEAALVVDTKGNLYGTTFSGGAYGYGTVFKLNEKGETILYSFTGEGDGANPVAGVTVAPNGHIYGTASAGGAYGYGTVFELTASSSGWKENTLYSFALQNDGGVPYAGLVLDPSGNLYGAATDGGGGGTNGGGTIFELIPSGTTWNFNVLYSLPGWGISGTFRNFLLDSSGNIWATTHCDGEYDSGTVFELTPSGNTWTYNSLYVFTGGADGEFVFSNLVFDKQGNLYGTANQGGANGYGVVFKITP